MKRLSDLLHSTDKDKESLKTDQDKSLKAVEDKYNENVLLLEAKLREKEEEMKLLKAKQADEGKLLTERLKKLEKDAEEAKERQNSAEKQTEILRKATTTLTNELHHVNEERKQLEETKAKLQVSWVLSVISLSFSLSLSLCLSLCLSLSLTHSLTHSPGLSLTYLFPVFIDRRV
jgi:hypothetical protein